MYRIDDTAASTTLPAPEAANPEGYWTEGSPASGVSATLIRASWLNMVQEELRNIVLAAGLTPSKTIYTQVRDSLIGRYLGTRVFTASGTYTPGVYNGVTAKTARFRGVSAGGGSGGTIATSSTQAAASAGGSAGTTFEFILSPASTQAITIGAPGAGGAAGAAGGQGGSLVIGAIATILGGNGSTGGNATGNFPVVSNPANPNITVSTISGTGVTVLLNVRGECGDRASILGSGNIHNGNGGSSPYGARGTIDSAGILGYGSGAVGQGVGVSTAATAGFAGGAGICLIDEYA